MHVYVRASMRGEGGGDVRICQEGMTVQSLLKTRHLNNVDDPSKVMHEQIIINFI